MSADPLKQLETATLGMAALTGWMAGVLFGTAVLGLLGLWYFAQSAPGVGTFLLQVLTALPGLMLIAIVGGIIALPAPFLAFALVWLAERISPRTRNLPLWFAVGISASLPSAWYVWSAPARFFYEEDGLGLGQPLTWDSLQLPALILACGVVGTYWAWRWRQAELAK